MTPRILVLLAVTSLCACGTGARSQASPSQLPRAVGFQTASADLRAPNDERNTDNDYVVGPILEPTEDGRPGVATYYIVRN